MPVRNPKPEFGKKRGPKKARNFQLFIITKPTAISIPNRYKIGTYSSMKSIRKKMSDKNQIYLVVNTKLHREVPVNWFRPKFAA